MEEKTYFCIRDVSHNGFIGTGSDHPDGAIYHYTNLAGNNDCCQWFFEEVKDVGTSSPVYRIYNKKYKNLCIAAGDYQDGSVYAQPPKNRRNAQWFIEPHDFGKTKAFKITDNKHEQSLCAGKNADNYVHHHVVGDEKNGGWQFLVVSEGKDLSNLPFHYEINIFDPHPSETKQQLKDVFKTKLTNDTSAIKTCISIGKHTVAFENSINTDNIISKKTMFDIESSIGVKVPYLKASLTNKFNEETYRYDKTSTYHNKKSLDEVEIRYEYDVDPYQTVQGRAEIYVEETTYDYTAEVRFQKLNGGFIIKNIKGSFKVENNLNINYVYTL